MHITLISPRGPLYRHRGGAWKKPLRYAPLMLTTLAALIPAELKASATLVDEGIEEADLAQHWRCGDQMARDDRGRAAGRAATALRRSRRPAADGVMTRRDLFRGKGYLPITLMQFSRGCRFACHFCAVSTFFDRGHYTRCVQEVVQEIEGLPRKQIIFFVFVPKNMSPDELTEATWQCRARITRWAS